MGDEGKGKYAHIFSKNAKFVLRTTGGNNAGHTVVVDRQMFTVHLLPSSIVRSDVLSIICSGVVIDPEVFNDEIEKMREQWIPISSEKLLVSNRAHVIFPYTKDMDLYQEYIKEEKIGTTKRGIGPCYADKINRIGLRMDDLLNCSNDEAVRKIRNASKTSTALLKKFLGKSAVEFDNIYLQAFTYWKQYRHTLVPYITDEREIIFRALEVNQKIIIEGAQSLYLDLDAGDYPYVTSSNPSTSGTAAAAGIGPKYIRNVL